MTLGAQFLDSFDWWFQELRGVWRWLVPKQKRSSASDWLVSVTSDGIRVNEANAPEFQSILLTPGMSPDEFLALLETGCRRKRPTFDIRIEPGLFLTRRLASQRLPIRQARVMAEIDLIASTPFDPSQVHLVFVGGPERGCSYHIVKRKTLAAILGAISKAGGSITGLSLASSDHELSADRLSLAALQPRNRGWYLTGSIRGAAVASLGLLLLGTYGHAQWRYWYAGLELEEQITRTQDEAKQARAFLQMRQGELARAEKVRDEKSTSPSIVRIWAELTRLLPDSVWLTDLSAKAGQLTMSGFAVSAASLVEPLENSPLFANPEFAGPVVKVPGQEGERFTIVARIEAP